MWAMQQRPSPRLSRPVYEGLPWFYIACGVAALVYSYLLVSSLWSLIVGLAGFAGLLGGFVVLLRRRDYRDLRSHYSDPDSLTGEDKD
jgi:membrane protein implicated in regulation of membrane protease activity